MNFDRKEILSILGWGEGIKIPAANEENRGLENQLAELIKKKSDSMINLCIMKENMHFTQKSLGTLNRRRDTNQEYLNRLRKQLDSEINLMKETELERSQQGNDVKDINKQICLTNDKIMEYKDNIRENTNKMMLLKDSLAWGEDALFDWEETVSRGERELQILENYQQLNEEKFEALEKEKKKVENELIEAEKLEKREEERFRMTTLQLENVNKLTKEASKEHDRLMGVWYDTMDTANLREEENKRLSAILCEVNNKARQKCSELYEEEKFYDDFKKTNDSITSEVMKYQLQYEKVKDDIIAEESAMKDLQNEANLRRKGAGNISGQIEFERAKNAELIAKNKARKAILEKSLDVVKSLKEECEALNMNSSSSSIAYRNAEEIYEMKQIQLEEEAKEIERLNLISQGLQQQISKLEEELKKKTKDFELATKVLKNLQTECHKKGDELHLVEEALLFLVEEERVLFKKILELRDKCSGKEEREELEKEIKVLEEQEGYLLNEHLQLRKRLECLQREFREKFRHLKTSGEELEKLISLYAARQVEYQKSRKDMQSLKDEQHKNNAQLKLLKMKELCLRENIIRSDSTVGHLERQRDLLEEAMKDRLIEVEAQKDVLLGKKRTLLEEKIMRTKQIDHIKSQIKLNQSRYTTTLDLLGKGDSGQQLSVAYFKIKLAQEKYELQIECDELEFKIDKTEKEVCAMENTLKWVKATNENYKFAEETLNENDAIKIENEKAESKYIEMKKIFELETKNIKPLKMDLEILKEEILYLKEKENEIIYNLKKKEDEFRAIDKENFGKNQRFERATNALLKVIKNVKKAKEPQKYKQLAKKEINIRMEEDRNHSALQQLTSLSSDFESMRRILEEYSACSSLPILHKPSLARPSEVHKRINTTQSTKSTSSSSSSKISIVNLNPAQLFLGIEPPCIFSSNKVTRNK